MSKKRKLKQKGKYKESAGLHTGEFKKAKWADELGERSWKEGPFRNRAVEVWNGERTVYKGHKTDVPGQRLWIEKNKKK